MAEFHQVGTADIVSQLPQLIPWNRSCTTGRPVSLLITCAGFEDRAVEAVKSIVGAEVQQHLIIEYPTNKSDNAEALRGLREVRAASTEILRYERAKFLKELSDFVEELAIPSGGLVLVDISAMSSYVLSRVFGVIFRKAAQSSMQILYAEADEYHPTYEAWKAFFDGVVDPNDSLSIASKYEELNFQARGADETYECDVFPGVNSGPLATSLVVVPSFSLQRVKSMTGFAESRYNVEPQSMRWFLGSPPDKKRNGWRSDALAALYNVKDHGVGVDTLDYRDILRKLDEMWVTCVESEKHLMIAAMGSKMQHVGMLLFLLMHDDCGLIHCEPSEFIADRYSGGVGPVWSLELGPVGPLVDILRSRQTLRFGW